jgi:DNA-binding beta-propeller fold protein YncE
MDVSRERGPATRRRFVVGLGLCAVLAAGAVAVWLPAGSGWPRGVAAEPVWPEPPPQGPAWPASPEPARIRYITSISTPKDVGAGPGFFGRVANVVLGKKGQPRLLRPRGLAADASGRLVVADPEQRMVHVFDVAAKKYSYLQPAPFASPVGVAVGPDNTIYVSDSGRRLVFAYDTGGRLKFALGSVKGEMIFRRPTGIAVSPDGRLYIVDTLAASVTIMDPRDGRVLEVFGRRGGGDGEFNYPTDVSLGPDGSVYVVDALNARIQVFGPNGELKRVFGRRGLGTGELDKPKGVAVDADGHVYVSDGLHDVVQIFDREGRLLLVVGQSGQAAGQFSLPGGMFIDRANRLYVADAFNARVQVFQYVSQPDAH